MHPDNQSRHILKSFSNLQDGKNGRFVEPIKKLNVLLLIVVVLVFIPLGANAGEVGELREMILKMEERHQQEMAILRNQIENLTQKKQQSPTNSGNELDDRFDRFEKKVEKSLQEQIEKANQTGFVSPKKWHFDFGGELEYEFVKTEDGAGVAKRNAHFQIDQLYLYPKVRYKDMALFSSDIAIKPSTAIIEEAWAQFYGLPFNTYVEVGLNDLFIANIQRKTETEILIESVFYRDDDMGLRIGGNPVDWLYWQIGVTNGFFLKGNRQVSEDPSFFMIADRKNLSDAADRPYIGVDVGFKANLRQYGKIDILPFYYNGLLTDDDVTFLQTVTGYNGTIRDDKKQRYGFNLRYDNFDFTLIGQLLIAEDGNLDRTGWFVQPSYLVYKNSDWKWFNAYEVLYRYNDLEVDLPNVFSDSLTWDRQQHVFALLISLFDYTTLKIEYNINDENTGGSSVDNDEFMTQLEIKW